MKVNWDPNQYQRRVPTTYVATTVKIIPNECESGYTVTPGYTLPNKLAIFG